MNKILSSRLIVLLVIVYLILQLITCGSEEETEDSTADKHEAVISKKSGIENISKTFDEFVNKKKDIELEIYPLRENGLYDPNEMIELAVEIYNPRHLTYQTYNSSMGDNSTGIKFNDMFVGSGKQSWIDNLTLLSVGDTNEDTIVYASVSLDNKKRINIGKGEIGSTKLLIKPGYFSKSLEIELLLHYDGNNINKNLIAKTSITLKENQADSLHRTVSTIEYLLAIGEKQKALDIAVSTAKQWPESYHARVLLGSAYEETNQFKEALRTYRKGLALFKDDRPGYITDYPENLWRKIKDIEKQLDEQK